MGEFVAALALRLLAFLGGGVFRGNRVFVAGELTNGRQIIGAAACRGVAGIYGASSVPR